MTRTAFRAVMETLKRAVEKEGLRPLSSRLELPVGVVRSAVEGRNLSADSLVSLADALGFEFYLGPKRDVGPPDPGHPLRGDIRFRNEEYSAIPLMDVNVSAGAGLLPVEGGAAEPFLFARSWLIRNGISADLSGLVTVRGDSMAPTLPDGSLILVQASEWQVERAGIYAFSRGGEVFVKRLTPIRSPGNGALAALAILSDNPAWAPELVAGEDMNDIRVAGRVRACITATDTRRIA